MLKLLGGFSAQQSQTQNTQQPQIDVNVSNRNPPAPDAARSTQPPFTTPQTEQPPAHNVMADVIARHEQLVFRARRK